jgi:hypothetical protein
MQGLYEVPGMLLGLKFEDKLLDKTSQDWQEAALLLIVMEQPADASIAL